MHFNFGTITFLLLLFFLPCFFLCAQNRQHFYFPKYQWIKQRPLLLSWTLWLKLLLFSLLVFALSKPFMYDSKHLSQKKGRDLILALDASGSMGQSGFNPEARFQTKYQSMLLLANSFIKNRYDDNMGLSSSALLPTPVPL